MKEEKGRIVYLTDPEAKFVSLVKRGANRTPFRIAKQQKERDMKVIQRIIARKGTDEAAIKALVGEEAAKALNLSAPKDSGIFTVYEQHSQEAFKSDKMEVISLNEDNSVLALCGELAEKSDGFSISRLLAKKSEIKVVEVPDSLHPVDDKALKSDLSCRMWEESDALYNAVRGILEQSAGENGTKVAMIKTIFDNFLASLETAVTVLKSEDFEPCICALKKESDSEKPIETEDGEKSCGGKDIKDKKAESDGKKSPKDKEKDEAEKSDSASPIPLTCAPSLERVEEIAGVVQKAIQPVLEEMSGKISSLADKVEKMQKLPATSISSHEDDGPKVDASKAQRNVQNVFAGCFGDLRR